jgi:hypothetical protein
VVNYGALDGIANGSSPSHHPFPIKHSKSFKVNFIASRMLAAFIVAAGVPDVSIV